jgi:hypothetical protein
MLGEGECRKERICPGNRNIHTGLNFCNEFSKNNGDSLTSWPTVTVKRKKERKHLLCAT